MGVFGLCYGSQVVWKTDPGRECGRRVLPDLLDDRSMLDWAMLCKAAACSHWVLLDMGCVEWLAQGYSMTS